MNRADDRDTSYGGDFVAKAAGLGIRTILTPVRAPTANAIAERVVGTLRRESLDHVIILGERHLRGLLREYVHHYNATRPHRALDGEALEGPRTVLMPIGPRQLVARPILGGLHHAYHCFRLLLLALRLLRRDRRDLVLENLVLRQQLALFERRGRRPALGPADRRFWSLWRPTIPSAQDLACAHQIGMGCRPHTASATLCRGLTS